MHAMLYADEIAYGMTQRTRHQVNYPENISAHLRARAERAERCGRLVAAHQAPDPTPRHSHCVSGMSSMFHSKTEGC